MTENAERKHRALNYVVVMLLLLAGLACRASTAPNPVRRRVLSILRPAEAYSRDLVIDAAHECGACALTATIAAPDGDNPDDALRLAQSFCMLAILLDNMLALFEPEHRHEAPSLNKPCGNLSVLLTARPSVGGGGWVREVAACRELLRPPPQSCSRIE